METNLRSTSIQKRKHAQNNVLQRSATVKRNKIKSIKFSGYEDVYDMYVKNHHNFAVNGGFIVHNCDSLRYAMELFMFTQHGQYMSYQERQKAVRDLGL
ncbi:hypothetical protein [Lactobacillus sp. UCMA15818]|uniref:hypothetical protein n=1 Tax=Lactobacillus sp. UCMA15818 TaxID=2583394 RepID=UPI0025B20009|nr:hypothetical protein [Lactobacillus sp. UCMA15818]